jgi:hypothetical protein
MRPDDPAFFHSLPSNLFCVCDAESDDHPDIDGNKPVLTDLDAIACLGAVNGWTMIPTGGEVLVQAGRV